MKTQTFFCPTEIVCGSGSLEKITDITSNYGTNCLLVEDPFFKDSKLEERIISLLPSKKVNVYSNVTPNPRTGDIDEGAKNISIDFIIAVGGGSAIDTAKAINVVYTNGGSSWDYTKGLGKQPKAIENKLLPLIAIPTTAGTGTEATRYSVITNSNTHEKATIKSDDLFPTKSIVDTDLMLTIPRKTTALTGIDAFAHCFESYIGIKANCFSDIFALKGIELFAKNIKKACEDGNDVEARENMAMCSTLGGLSISHSATTLPHSIGQALSGIADAPHGGSIAVCMCEVIKWTLPEAKDKFAKVACIFDESLKTKDIDAQANALPEILEKLFKEIIGQDLSMKDYGINEDNIDKVADMALTNYNGDISRHPKIATREDLIQIIKNSL